ncbi:hypothetical protein OG455_16500 [Kitasatospora sp. NBC_01287]|uniref:hypothetical protein n=1 Tax=Kitasatospora sp. NBC_01287 TaxID=2903573 RepID=UPI0022550E8B|nr:hypothetical protein [Kitasatospora sp. NBC_01287]MCX4747100.1 hypothetical protein [Kitasatospora sp. NBC_01287]
MAGQFPGQFGPVPARVVKPKGPFGVGGKVLLCLAAVLTGGLLGFLPPLLLAVRRKQRVDVLGAVLFGALSLLMMVCAGIAGQDKRAVAANAIGEITMGVLIVAAPTYFLLMDRRGRYPLAAGHAVPGYGAAGYAVPGYAPPGYVPPGYAAPTLPVPPGYGAPGHQSYPSYQQQPTQQQEQSQQQQQQPPVDELQRLGELLRRQAEDGGR